MQAFYCLEVQYFCLDKATLNQLYIFQYSCTFTLILRRTFLLSFKTDLCPKHVLECYLFRFQFFGYESGWLIKYRRLASQ